MENVRDIVREQAKDTLEKLNAQNVVTAEQVADSVLHQAAYWEKPISGGERLLFVRLFSPVVQREEVFLGNILFNAFLSKAFTRAIADGKLGHAELVANDLENYYFLVRTASGVSELANALRAEVECRLPDLFFGEQDEALGIYGDLSRMFTFRKSDFEPFPIYAIPQFLSRQLEKAVRRQLERLLDPKVFPDHVRTVLATLAFFYGRTSGGSGDAQSFPYFVDHLVNDRDYDGLLKASDVKKAFNISAASKPEIKQSIDDGTYDGEKLRGLLSNLARDFQRSIDSGSTKWLLGYLLGKERFLSVSPAEYLNLLLADQQLGYELLARVPASESAPCRVCGMKRADVEDGYVTIGLNSYKFDNQSVRGQAEKVCAKCALLAYLAQKLLGTEMVSAGGKLPQVPKAYNLLFHYGRHDDSGVDQLARKIDTIWSLVRQHRDMDQVRRDIASQVRDLTTKSDREQDIKKKENLAKALSDKKHELERVQENVKKVEDDIFAVCPWLKTVDASPSPSENCSLDVIANIQLSETKVERHVLGLGLGGYRMVLFVLPQIRAPRNAKEHDFAQRRFSDSRVTVTALLALLRELCGCDGPFYYQSLPTLTPEGFDPNTFYIRNEAINVDKALNEYEVVTQLAWKLVRQHGSDGFVRKVVLAEKLLEDPLGTFAAVMRDSAILGQRKGTYKKLGGQYRTDWQAQDLTEYAKFIQRLSNLKEVE
jgi:hypothetical protein